MYHVAFLGAPYNFNQTWQTYDLQAGEKNRKLRSLNGEE